MALLTVSFSQLFYCCSFFPLKIIITVFWCHNLLDVLHYFITKYNTVVRNALCEALSVISLKAKLRIHKCLLILFF